MKAKLLLAVSTLAIVALSVIGFKIYSSIESVDSSMPYENRPQNIPAKALWAGGPDGGIFIEIKRSSSKKNGEVDVVLYHDHTGDIIYKGLMKNESNIENSMLNRDIYEGWDGEKLHISAGGWLVPSD